MEQQLWHMHPAKLHLCDNIYSSRRRASSSLTWASTSCTPAVAEHPGISCSHGIASSRMDAMSHCKHPSQALAPGWQDGLCDCSTNCISLFPFWLLCKGQDYWSFCLFPASPATLEGMVNAVLLCSPASAVLFLELLQDPSSSQKPS